MKVSHAMPRSVAKEWTSDKPWAAIQIGDEEGDWPKLNKCQRVDVLQLAFHDIDRIMEGHTAFCNKDAERVFEFIERVWDKIDVLIVHCYAGQSRSPAIAAAIDEIYNGVKVSEWYSKRTPNRRVYGAMIKVWGRNNGERA